MAMNKTSEGAKSGTVAMRPASTMTGMERAVAVVDATEGVVARYKLNLGDGGACRPGRGQNISPDLEGWPG